MRSSILRAATTLATLATFACSSSYHPEYHPVTVTNFSQNINYPVNASGSVVVERGALAPAEAARPTIVIPEAGPAYAEQPEPPPDFFR